MWFDAELAEGVGFSNAPGKPTLVYGHAFFPFAEPLELNPGDRVAVTIQSSLVGGEYQWRWKTRTCGPRRPRSSRRELRPVNDSRHASIASPIAANDGNACSDTERRRRGRLTSL